MLRAITACTFSTSQLPKVVRDRQFLTLLTSKCASRHNGVQFVISHLASWLRTRRFSEPTFRPTGATNHWKNTVFRDFPTFSRICIFFLLILSLLTLLTSAFQLSIWSEVSLLHFLRQYCHAAEISGIVYYVTCCYAADGVGWGGVGGYVNVPCTSYIQYCHAAEISGIVYYVTCCYAADGVGWGGVGGHVNVPLHLRHEVVATSWMGWGLGGVGWGMLTFPCTCVMKLLLRRGWGGGWVGWGGAC